MVAGSWWMASGHPKKVDRTVRTGILDLIKDNARSLGLHSKFRLATRKQSHWMCSCEAKEVSGEWLDGVLPWSASGMKVKVAWSRSMSRLDISRTLRIHDGFNFMTRQG
ncbi:hypothetical protein ACLKA6_003601 [Drosophila palustris]